MVRPHYGLYCLLIILPYSILSCTAPAASTSAMLHESQADREKAFAENPEALYPIRQNEKWGYINRKGDIVIPIHLDHADNFYHQMALAGTLKDGKLQYGYIDPSGEWIIPPAFEKARTFSEGLAVVSCDNLYGYIDRTGTEVIPCQYEEAGDFHGAIAAVKQSGWTGFIDGTGTMIISPQYTCSVHHPQFVGGLAPVFGADEQTGFINMDGKWVIPPSFHSAGNFSEGKAWAMIQRDDPEAPHGFTIRGGYIDTSGAYVIAPEYQFGWDFVQGYATVWTLSDDKKTKYWHVMNHQGQRVLENLTYRNVGAFHRDVIPVQNEAMMWGYIDLKGNVVIEPVFTGINRFYQGLAMMEKGSAFDPRIVYINPKGEIVWEE